MYGLENLIRDNIPFGSTRVVLSTAKEDWHFLINEGKAITLDIITEPNSREILSVTAQVKRCPADGLFSPEEIEVLSKEYGGDYGISVLGTPIFGGRYNPIDREEAVEQCRYLQKDTYVPIFNLLGIEYCLTGNRLSVAQKQNSLLLTPERIKEAYSLLCEKKENPSLYNSSEDRSFEVMGSRPEIGGDWIEKLNFEVGKWKWPHRQGPLTSEKIKGMERTLRRHGWAFIRLQTLTSPTVYLHIKPFRQKLVYTENDQDGGFP